MIEATFIQKLQKSRDDSILWYQSWIEKKRKIYQQKNALDTKILNKTNNDATSSTEWWTGVCIFMYFFVSYRFITGNSICNRKNVN